MVAPVAKATDNIPSKLLMKRTIKQLFRRLDFLVAIALYPAAFLLKFVRNIGIEKMPHCRQTLLKVGVFPITRHYYEPLFETHQLQQPLNQERQLPGIDFNINEQLQLLESFKYGDEFKELLKNQDSEPKFHFQNDTFESGDAEYFYNLIRTKKPQKIFEIGSGNSTLIARMAIVANAAELSEYYCQHVCIEPFEAPWLESTNVEIIRKRVENIDISFFLELSENDILFIDSSHIIRPQGDVLFEYLEILPQLNSGVIVHIHDIFTPRDYLKAWILEQVRFWNEQYLLEAFLTFNNQWKVVGALNYLHYNYYEILSSKCPFLTKDREPGSFYIQKI